MTVFSTSVNIFFSIMTDSLLIFWCTCGFLSVTASVEKLG